MPVVDIVGLTGLNLATLAEADVLATLPAIREAGPRRLWVELTEIFGVRLLSGTGRLPTSLTEDARGFVSPVSFAPSSLISPDGET